MGVDNNWGNPIIVRLTQHRQDFTVRACRYCQGTTPLTTAETIGIGEYWELRNPSDAVPDAHRHEAFIRRAAGGSKHEAGAQAKPPPGGGSIKIFIHLKITGPDADGAWQTPTRERREAEIEETV